MLGMTSKVPVFVIFSWLKFWGGGGQIWQTRIIFEPTCAYARWAHMHRFLRQGLFWSAHRRISAHFPRIPTPLRSVQICSDNGSIYEGVGPLERVKILRNQPKMASFSPANALQEQSLWDMKAGNETFHTDSSHVPLKFSGRRQCHIHVKIHPDHCLNLPSSKKQITGLSINKSKDMIIWGAGGNINDHSQSLAKAGLTPRAGGLN